MSMPEENAVKIEDGIATHCPRCKTTLFIKNEMEILFLNNLFVHWIKPDFMEVRCRKCKKDKKIS